MSTAILEPGRSRAGAILAALFAVVVWGASFIATKIAVGEVAPLTVVWLRFGMGVAVMGLVVLARRGLKRYPSAGMMFWVMTFGWLLSGVLFLAGPGISDVSRLSSRGWMAVVFLGVFCSGLAYVFWYDALSRLPSSQVGTFLYIEPLVTVAIAASMLGEKLTVPTLAGGLAILIGVWMVSLRSPS